jgi:hypothetical protein
VWLGPEVSAFRIYLNVAVTRTFTTGGKGPIAVMFASQGSLTVYTEDIGDGGPLTWALWWQAVSGSACFATGDVTASPCA